MKNSTNLNPLQRAQLAETSEWMIGHLVAIAFGDMNDDNLRQVADIIVEAGKAAGIEIDVETVMSEELATKQAKDDTVGEARLFFASLTRSLAGLLDKAYQENQ